ncbi:RICIN domain-containing protein [Streptomyces sp. WM6368]|uniref:RICIN domain-containing protein n=1 Tax=Streptomyces sp. WM6368 TaxID=1415554 RepID=UPI0006ADBC0A|nr:RICIN domain-containing protein [Streptomyces sp. WM6368]
MGKAGRPQGALKGATDEANALARFLRTMTDSLTVRELAERYGGGKTLWGEYRCGARVIPLGRLNTVLRDRVRDPRGRLAMLEQARRLHDAALTAEVELGPAPALDEALRRAEQDLAGSGELVSRLLAIITMLLRVPAAPAPAAAQDPGRVRGHLDEALDQLDTALTVQSAAEGACADARAESAADTGPAATAGPRLSLALALVGSALDHRRSEAVRLWQEIREDGLDRWAEPDGPNGPDGPVEGVVLERVDTRSTAAVTVSDPAPGAPDATEVLPATGSRALGPRPRPRRPTAGRERGLPLVALVTAALFGITTVTAAAVAVLLTRQYATASAAGTAPRADASPGPVPVPAPAGSSPGPSPSAPTPPPTTTTATPPPGPTAPGTADGVPRPSAPAPSGPAPAPSAPSPSAPPAGTGDPKEPPTLPDGLFRLTNTGSRMCLSADRGSTVPSGGLVQTGCGADSDQFWKLTAESTGPEGTVYALRNLHSGLCLSVDAARTADDALVTQYLCGDEDGLFPDQFWTFRYNAPHRAWHLVNRNSGKCVSVRPDAGNNDQALQASCTAQPWLLWRT